MVEAKVFAVRMWYVRISKYYEHDAFTHNQAPTFFKTRASLVLIATLTLSGLAFSTTSQESVALARGLLRLLLRQSCFSLVSDFARLSVQAVCMHEKWR